MIATLFTVAVAAPVLALASASAAEFQFPDSVPMHKRQTSGPKFECHSACGNTILQSQSNADYCDDSTWNGLFEDCMDCALEFEIWQYYSPQVKPAAEACGLDPTPKPVGGGSEGGSDTTTSAAAQTTSEAAATEAASTTEAAAEEPTEAATEAPVEEPTEAATRAPTEAASEAPAATEGGEEAAASTDAEYHSDAAHPTTLTTAEAKPDTTAPAGHGTDEHTDVVPPTPEPTPVEAGAGAVGLSQMTVAVGAVVAMMAIFN
jgi:hypothetical protein